MKPLLVLENPDFILAAVEGVNALAMEDLILDLREVRECFFFLFPSSFFVGVTDTYAL